MASSSSNHRVFDAVIGGLVLTAVVTSASPARADNEACLAAYTDNQRLRKSGKLIEARAALTTCVEEACPDLVRQDCTLWLDELEAALPTVVFAVRGPDGDVVDAAIEVDGVPLEAALEGRPVPLDPGRRQLRFVHEGETIERSIVVRQGEKARLIEVRFGTAPPPVTEPPRGDVAASGGDGLLIAGAVVGGLGVVGMAVFAGFGITGMRDADALHESCGAEAPPPATNTCTQEAIDAVHSDLVVADVALGVGAVLLATGVTLLVVHLATDTAVAVGASSLAVTTRF